MLFNSFQFLIFFPVVTISYFLLPHRYRWALLLAASCYFYMQFIPVYILILLATITVDYIAGILIEDTQGVRRKQYLIFSIIANIGALAIFKYCNFINDNMIALAQLIGWNYPIEHLNVILPIGLSFHTFQSLSYTIEVYRGHQKAERNLGIFALYVMFYPQLVAGPIERPQNLLHQFYEKHTFDYQRVTDGLKLMGWGLFKKMVIADRLAASVNNVYNNPTEYSGIPLIIATYFFAVQIYCDFSGYSDIALGASQVMGFKLMTNFKQPYYARSISEFWKRWHISLSTWFKDYLYISLGGNRVSKWRWYANLMIVFLVSGLWHGANWTFVIWGGLHGFYLVLAIWITDWRVKVYKFLGLESYPTLRMLLEMFVTFHLVWFAWIFFRANSITDALYIVSHLFVGLNLQSGYGIGIGGMYELVIALAMVLIMETVHIMQQRGSVRQYINQKPIWVRWTLYYALVLSIMMFGKFGLTEFIYFQF